ncbi:unnamed protein product [Fusarium graminearum]|nr:unnamed protein product [Fusarium graminearum]CAG1986999.1 unnamed protein product [Fusarium graminearum]CAG1987677.1 unnamed protein product [Fusarium graminearum]VTO89251.1 unnamed protein product [Fusarium graminearum]
MMFQNLIRKETAHLMLTDGGCRSMAYGCEYQGPQSACNLYSPKDFPTAMFHASERGIFERGQTDHGC